MERTTHPIYPIHPGWHCALAVCLGFALHLASSPNARAAANVFSDVGLSPASIQDKVDEFRASLGGVDNGVGGGPFTTGFRNINWDGVPDMFASINTPLPGNFFNANSPRGLVMQTLGAGFLVSANAGGSIAPEFGSIDPSYPGTFQPFSNQKLFTAIGSTQTTVTFFVPSSPGTAASVLGFGVVFSDVDIIGGTSLTFFDVDGGQLGIFNVPLQNGGFSFLGVSFDGGERVGSVRINSGSDVLGLGVVDGGPFDVAVMDDFMYSEPQAIVPEPCTAMLILLGIGGQAAFRRRVPLPPVA
jgi:hypothetical protein